MITVDEDRFIVKIKWNHERLSHIISTEMIPLCNWMILSHVFDVCFNCRMKRLPSNTREEPW